MPLLQVNVLSGYSDHIKQRLCRELTHTVTGVLEAQPEGISVWIHEVSAAGYTRGGQPRTPAAEPERDPRETVLAYLADMEARDLDRARSHLADDFCMTFPGGQTFALLEDLVAWSKGRYRFVTKTIHSTEAAYGPEHVVVTCHGELAGEWPDGQPFEAVRFIDRFELRGGRIHRQDVWNDLAVTAR